MRYHTKTLPFSIHKKHPYKFDSNGILLTKIPYTQEYHPHATAIASYVIATSDKVNLEWLLDNMNSDGAIHHNFTFPFYPMEKGWVGGLAQGLTASALAMHNHPEESLLAVHAIEKYCDNGFCILEYPNVEILNGWIYAIFGIYDSGNMEYFKFNIRNLKRRLHLYDLNNWSKYDLYNHYPASRFYHTVHQQQLLALLQLTHDPVFYKYFHKWSRSIIFALYNTTKRNLKIILKNGPITTVTKYRQRRRWLHKNSSSM